MSDFYFTLFYFLGDPVCPSLQSLKKLQDSYLKYLLLIGFWLSFEIVPDCK